MAGKKPDNEDTRDVFEKALDGVIDYSVPIGVVLGAAGGGALLRKSAKNFARDPRVKAYANTPEKQKEIERYIRSSTLRGGGAGATLGGMVGLGTSTAGMMAEYGDGEQIKQRKRRK